MLPFVCAANLTFSVRVRAISRYRINAKVKTKLLQNGNSVGSSMHGCLCLEKTMSELWDWRWRSKGMHDNNFHPLEDDGNDGCSDTQKSQMRLRIWRQLPPSCCRNTVWSKEFSVQGPGWLSILESNWNWKNNWSKQMGFHSGTCCCFGVSFQRTWLVILLMRFLPLTLA